MASGWSDLNQDGGYSKRESVDGTCVHCRSGDTQEAEHVVLRGGSWPVTTPCSPLTSIAHTKGSSQSSKGADGSLSFAVLLPVSSTRSWGCKCDELFYLAKQPETTSNHIRGRKTTFLPNPVLLCPAHRSSGKGQGTVLNAGLWHVKGFIYTCANPAVFAIHIPKLISKTPSKRKESGICTVQVC